jgi:hypothetical protein
MKLPRKKVDFGEGAEGGSRNNRVFYVLSLCLVVFLFLVVMSQAFLCMLVVFRCCYISRYMPFQGCVYCCIATWSCLDVAT